MQKGAEASERCRRSGDTQYGRRISGRCSLLCKALLRQEHYRITGTQNAAFCCRRRPCICYFCGRAEYAKKHKLGVVKELVGHGIGSHLHEDPEVPNYGKTGTGIILKKGMTIAVEPMLNLGTAKVYLLDDDWTIVTGDNKPSAHFEHTIIVTDDGYEILTGDDKCE